MVVGRDSLVGKLRWDLRTVLRYNSNSNNGNNYDGQVEELPRVSRNRGYARSGTVTLLKRWLLSEN